MFPSFGISAPRWLYYSPTKNANPEKVIFGMAAS
jgi:hypothetical protein